MGNPWLLSRCFMPRVIQDLPRKGQRMRANNAFERTHGRRGRAVCAMDCVLGGAEWAPYQAAQLGR